MKESTKSIRSYVRRAHRMTPGQARALQELWPCYGLSVEAGWLDSESEYILEIGFGMGQSLLTMAAQYPEKKFIGIEVHRPGIGALLASAARQNINNVRIYENDAEVILKQCIRNETLSKIQIFFPDPWPKQRHQKRRLIQTEFVRLLEHKLKPGGYLHLATDWQDYAKQMLNIVENMPTFSNCAGAGQYLSHRNGRPLTKFEQRGLNASHPIRDLLFTKIKHPL